MHSVNLFEALDNSVFLEKAQRFILNAWQKHVELFRITDKDTMFYFSVRAPKQILGQFFFNSLLLPLRGHCFRKMYFCEQLDPRLFRNKFLFCFILTQKKLRRYWENAWQVYNSEDLGEIGFILERGLVVRFIEEKPEVEISRRCNFSDMTLHLN
jgi:hypothetical protein